MKTQGNIGWVIFSIIAVVFASQMTFSNQSMKKMDMLKKDVEEAYYRRYIDPITITVPESGTVLLKGEVSTYWDKLNVFSIVAKVKGVTKIMNELTVNTNSVPDNIIKDQILNEYHNNRLILEPDSIKVGVNNGMVILTGTVSFNKESIAVEEIAGWWEGVKSVDNVLNVMSPTKAESDANLTALVQDVLMDDFSIGAKNVTAKVTRGVATLTGTVENYWVKYAIKKELLNILGIKKVDEKLTVVPENE